MCVSLPVTMPRPDIELALPSVHYGSTHAYTMGILWAQVLLSLYKKALPCLAIFCLFVGSVMQSVKSTAFTLYAIRLHRLHSSP